MLVIELQLLWPPLLLYGNQSVREAGTECYNRYQETRNTFDWYMLAGMHPSQTTANMSQNTAIGANALRQQTHTTGASYFNTAVGR